MWTVTAVKPGRFSRPFSSEGLEPTDVLILLQRMLRSPYYERIVIEDGNRAAARKARAKRKADARETLL